MGCNLTRCDAQDQVQQSISWHGMAWHGTTHNHSALRRLFRSKVILNIDYRILFFYRGSTNAREIGLLCLRYRMHYVLNWNNNKCLAFFCVLVFRCGFSLVWCCRFYSFLSVFFSFFPEYRLKKNCKKSNR